MWCSIGGKYRLTFKSIPVTVRFPSDFKSLVCCTRFMICYFTEYCIGRLLKLVHHHGFKGAIALFQTLSNHPIPTVVIKIPAYLIPILIHHEGKI
jgi:hypothetical protein